MNIARTIPNAVNAYPGVAFEIYLSGCRNRCPGCHSKELWDFDFGRPMRLTEITDELTAFEDWFDIISILGGDPLDQNPIEFMIFMVYIKAGFPGKELWLFTGKERHEIPNWAFKHFDVIKCGPYREDEAQPGFPASANQQILRKGVDY